VKQLGKKKRVERKKNEGKTNGSNVVNQRWRGSQGSAAGGSASGRQEKGAKAIQDLSIRE